MQFWLENSREIYSKGNPDVHGWMILKEIRHENVSWLTTGTGFCDNSVEPQGSKTE
jgi:hypothetical protein